MFCDSSLCWLCCFPLGMLCFSAVSIMLVSIVFTWCEFCGISMSVSVCSFFCKFFPVKLCCELW